jgi:anaerobic ribonucleoside-triphosphate reductase activating protein
MCKIKYVDSKIVFSEIPNEITLAISISDCQIKCKDCHSKYLIEDKGTLLTKEELFKIINENQGITCLCFMGEGKYPEDINYLAKKVRNTFNLKIAYYTGYNKIPKEIDLKYFDFIKIGPYISSLGGLNKSTTNQRMYSIKKGKIDKDITYVFYKNN